MSYILDALKKIEHEKSRKTGPGGRINISGDLFQERNRPTAKPGIWKIVLLVVVVSLVTGAAIWFFLPGYGRKSAAVIPPAATPAAPVPPPTVTTPAPPPVQPPSAPVAAPSAAPSAAVPVAPKNTETADGEEPASRGVRRSEKRIKAQPPAPSPKQPIPTVQPPADIKLSGIAWQDERAARRAVINGFLLKEGAVVLGAKIIDIRADSVRFSSASGQFVIKLNAVLPPEVKR